MVMISARTRLDSRLKREVPKLRDAGSFDGRKIVVYHFSKWSLNALSTYVAIKDGPASTVACVVNPRPFNSSNDFFSFDNSLSKFATDMVRYAGWGPVLGGDVDNTRLNSLGEESAVTCWCVLPW